jgi:hypothetical protein
MKELKEDQSMALKNLRNNIIVSNEKEKSQEKNIVTRPKVW